MKTKLIGRLLLATTIVVCIIIVNVSASKADMYKQALDNIIVEQYIDARLELQTALGMIETGRANKLVACEKIPSEVRTQKEVFICGK